MSHTQYLNHILTVSWRLGFKPVLVTKTLPRCVDSDCDSLYDLDVGLVLGWYLLSAKSYSDSNGMTVPGWPLVHTAGLPVNRFYLDWSTDTWCSNI